MKLYVDFDEFEPWCEAVETWEKIKEVGKVDWCKCGISSGYAGP